MINSNSGHSYTEAGEYNEMENNIDEFLKEREPLIIQELVLKAKSEIQKMKEKKESIYDVDFGGNVMARIKIVGDKIEVTNAMNGYGNSIPLSEITITNSNQ